MDELKTGLIALAMGALMCFVSWCFVQGFEEFIGYFVS